MANETFELHFKSDNTGKKTIDEPIGYAICDFQLKQEDKRYARDISFAGGSAELSFSSRREHELENILYYFNKFGFESHVSLLVNSIEIGDLDFKDAATDGLTYFKCKVVQSNKQALVKKRKDIQINLLNDKDLDDNPIEPLVPINILLKAKPILQKSIWKSNGIAAGGFSRTSDDFDNPDAFGNPYHNGITTTVGANNSNVVEKYGISNTLSFISNTYTLNSVGFPNGGLNFTYLEAFDNLKNVNIKISNLNANVYQEKSDFFTNLVLTGSGYVRFVVKYGFDNGLGNNLTTIVLWEKVFGFVNFTNPEYLPTSFNVNIPYLERGMRVWIYLEPFSQATFNQNNVDSLAHYSVFSIMENMDVEITGTSISFNSITPAFRLYDVMTYLVKSMSGMNILAPEFQIGSDLYDQFLFNGNFLRNIIDKGFNLTLKDIEEGLTEFNADYEIQPDERVFFGMYREFYKSVEMMFFDSVQFDNMTVTSNPRYVLNEFYYKWSSYQSQKENSLDNTYDSVHGESQWLFKNKFVENKKEVSITWIRDAFMIEENRKKAFEDSSDKATQDDDKLFILDAIEIEEESERIFTETTKLLHSYNSTNDTLILTNSGNFNWIILGIAIGDTFDVLSTENFGTYEVVAVSSNALELNMITPGTPNIQGEFVTIFRYIVTEDTAVFTNWTDEGFTLIDNINNGYNYSNLRFSAKRNIINYWQEYLATANEFHKAQTIKNTFYKNNPDALTVYEGIEVTEGEEFIPTGQLITSYLHKDVIFICEQEEFDELQNKVRTDRGFVRFIRNDGIVKKGFPVNLSYSKLEKRLICDLEEKYEPAEMTISTAEPGVILINNETRLFAINYKFLNQKLYIYDVYDELMYNGVYWNDVSVNGVLPSTIYELKSWLDLL